MSALMSTFQDALHEFGHDVILIGDLDLLRLLVQSLLERPTLEHVLLIDGVDSGLIEAGHPCFSRILVLASQDQSRSVEYLKVREIGLHVPLSLAHLHVPNMSQRNDFPKNKY